MLLKQRLTLALSMPISCTTRWAVTRPSMASITSTRQVSMPTP